MPDWSFGALVVIVFIPIAISTWYLGVCNPSTQPEQSEDNQDEQPEPGYMNVEFDKTG